MRRRYLRLFPWALAGIAVTAGVATLSGDEKTSSKQSAADAAAAGDVERIASEHLPNLVKLHPRVLSGGLPEGEAGFAELRDLGVKTVISVDGMKPDVATAKKYGLRYVHLPHGYDGIPKDRIVDLAKAFRDLPGPVYVHCHHGKHRSPAAAATGCVAAGLIAPGEARDVLELAGTSEHYEGLYDAAETVRPLDPKLLDAAKPDFPEIARIPAMAEAMVAVAHAHEHMQAVADAGWKAPPKHPDVVPAHEALMLRELFTELLRTDDVRSRPEQFRDFLKVSESAGFQLEAALRANDAGAAKIALDQISTNCKACHNVYRDVPLDEKQ